KENACKEVITKGFAEPGAVTFDEIVGGELKDVQYKTVILANHSKLYEKVVTLNDVHVEPYCEGLRCSVFLTKENIVTGFIGINEDFAFPSGVNNCLYINGQKVVEGPGAGSRPTAERMFKDFKER